MRRMQTVMEDVVTDAQHSFKSDCSCRALCDYMEAEVSVFGDLAQIHISTGLRQGCVLAPTLSLLYFNMVMQCYRDRSEGLGVKLLYKCSEKLVVERNRAPGSYLVTELSSADDTIITAGVRE